MRSLVLVDLDNVATLRREQVGLGEVPMPVGIDGTALTWIGVKPGPGLPAAPLAEEAKVVIALALNIRTAQRFTFSALDAFAEALAEVLQLQGSRGLEVALALVAPQTADALIERLLTEASAASTAGKFQRVFLVSRDRGLRRALEAQLKGERYRGRGVVAVPEADVVGWEARFAVKRQPPLPSVAATPEPPSVAAYSTDINRPELAAWAQTQSLGLPAGDLPELVAVIEQRPGLLSQVGPTLTSMRGIARLPTGASAGATVGACHVSDGLELGMAAAPLGEGEELSASSVGIGTVRLRGRRATVRTRIPLGVLRDFEGPLPLSATSAMVDDDLVLERMRPDALYGEGFEVGFKGQSGKDLVCWVERAFRHQVNAWWIRDRDQSGPGLRSQLSLPGLGGLLPSVRPERIPARLRRLPGPGGTGSTLAAQTPAVAGSTPVSLLSAVSPFQLGVALGGSIRMLVLALGTPLEPGPMKEWQPIQDVSVVSLRQAHPGLPLPDRILEELQKLPLVVPFRVGPA